MCLFCVCCRPQYVKHFQEENLLEWQYSKYKNHIEVSIGGRTIISERCDTIMSVSDKHNTIFISSVESKGEYHFFLQNGSPLIHDSCDGYRIISEKSKEYSYLTIDGKDSSGAYGLDGKTIVPYGIYRQVWLYGNDNFGALILAHASNPSAIKDEEIITLFDTNGNQLVSYQCQRLEPVIVYKQFWEGWTESWDNASISDVKIVGYIVSNKDQKEGLLNSYGKLIIPIEFDGIDFLRSSKNFSHCLWEAGNNDSDKTYVYNTTGMSIYSYKEYEEYMLDDDYSTNKYCVRGEIDCGNDDDMLWLSVTNYQMGIEKAIDTLGNEVIPYQANRIRTYNGIFQEAISDKNGVKSFRDYKFPKYKNRYFNKYGLAYDIEFFDTDDFIRVNGGKYNRTGYCNVFSVYEHSSFGMTASYFYVGSNYQVYYVTRLWNSFKFEYEYDYDKMTMSEQQYGTKSYRDDRYNEALNSSGNINQPMYDSNVREAQYYKDTYQRYSKNVESFLNTLKILKSDNKPNGTTSYSINETIRNIKDAQNSMSRLRNEALGKGVVISPSYYETCSF